MGLPAPRARPVELYINDSATASISRPNTSTRVSFVTGILCRSNIQGEQYNADLVPGTERHLLKILLFGPKSRPTTGCLKTTAPTSTSCSIPCGRAENEPAAFSRLKEVLPISIWAKFAAYQVLVQSGHNSSMHNMRLISDVWRGQVLPLPYDTGLGFRHASTPAQLPLDFTSNDILRTLSQSSEFLDAQVYRARRGIRTRQIYRAMQKSLRDLREQFGISAERDIYLAKLKYYSDFSLPTDP